MRSSTTNEPYGPVPPEFDLSPTEGGTNDSIVIPDQSQSAMQLPGIAWGILESCAVSNSSGSWFYLTLDINLALHHDAYMRTTLTLDSDVAEALRERARLLDLSFKQVVNDTLRRGMLAEANGSPAPRYRVAPKHSTLAPEVDPLKLNQLNDQLAAEAFSQPDAD